MRKAAPRKRGRPPKFDVTEVRMQTTTISLDDKTHFALRTLALERRVPFRDLVREALADYLRRQSKGR